MTEARVQILLQAATLVVLVLVLVSVTGLGRRIDAVGDKVSTLQECFTPGAGYGGKCRP